MTAEVAPAQAVMTEDVRGTAGAAKATAAALGGIKDTAMCARFYRQMPVLVVLEHVQVKNPKSTCSPRFRMFNL